MKMKLIDKHKFQTLDEDKDYIEFDPAFIKKKKDF